MATRKTRALREFIAEHIPDRPYRMGKCRFPNLGHHKGDLWVLEQFFSSS
jgi:hypothetical protein